MSKRASTSVRVIAVLAVIAATVAVVVIVGHDPDYGVTARFEDGGQLVPGDQVRLGTVSVGDVQSIELAQDGLVDVRLRLTGEGRPLPEGTIARVRLESLSGVANRYVSLEKPLEKRKDIPNGGVLPITQTQSPVDLDMLFNTLDGPTRRGLRSVIRGGAQNYRNRSDAARQTLGYLSPALEGTSDFAAQLTKDSEGFDALLRRGAVAAHALNGRRAALTSLVANAQTTTQALADEQGALGESLRRLPGVLRQGTRTFAGLRATLPPLTRLVNASKPSASQLPAFFGRLDTVLRRGAAPLSRVADTVRQPGASNDLVDLLRDSPRLDALSRTAFPRAIRAMNRSSNDFDDLRAYTPDLFGALTRLGQVTANYDANGHYARIQPNLLALTFDPSDNTLKPSPEGNAIQRLQTGRSRRCPGGTVPRAPGDTQRVVEGCDPNADVGKP